MMQRRETVATSPGQASRREARPGASRRAGPAVVVALAVAAVAVRLLGVGDVACKHTTLHYTRGTASLEAKPVTHSVTGMMARAYSLSSRRARPGERANRVARSPSEWLGKDGGENEGMCKTARCAPRYSPPRHSTRSTQSTQSTRSTRSTRSTQSMHG